MGTCDLDGPSPCSGCMTPNSKLETFRQNNSKFTLGSLRKNVGKPQLIYVPILGHTLDGIKPVKRLFDAVRQRPVACISEVKAVSLHLLLLPVV